MSIKINIGSLKEGSHQLELETSTNELGLREHIVKGIRVFLDLFKTNNQLDIKAKIKGLFEFECDRCLDLYEKQFEQDLELVYVQKSRREESFNDDYLRTYDPNMKTVDITADVKEMVVLAVPMRRVPTEKNDGSCSWCGKTKDYWHQFIVDEEELESEF
ncbi:MAG TPA: DUF177 domain-containing protein [Ignavibacteria bacterium]